MIEEVVKETSYGLSMDALVSTLLYTALGIVIMVIAVSAINMLFRLNMRKELIGENNAAYGVAVAGFAVAVGIIIAGSISG